jgi:Immunoglobulin domain
VPERLYLPRGLMGRIDCPVESNPPLTVIVWSKSGRLIDFQQVRHAKVNKQGTLIFNPVISADEGQYSCTPYSPLGAGHPSTPIRVFVRGLSTSSSVSVLCLRRCTAVLDDGGFVCVGLN